MCLKLQEDAIFIADSHFNPNTARGLLGYLAYLAQENPPTQLVLLGDISQVLVGSLKSSIKANMELIEALQKLEEKNTQIIWLEGNHDFFLSPLQSYLPRTLFVPRSQQPLLAEFGTKHYLLAHGDLFLGIRYKIYIHTLLSLKPIFSIIDLLSNGEVYEEIQEKLEKKPIRSYHPYFFEFAHKRIDAYKQANPQLQFDGIIEGHFHIGKKISSQGITYFSLPSFYFTQQGIHLEKLLQQDKK